MPKVSVPGQKKAGPAPKEGGRVDPAPRPIDPSGQLTELRNKDPNLHYVLVNLAIGRNRQVYSMQGYRPVSSEEDGVQPVWEDVPYGETIEIAGQTLMACPKGLRLEYEQRGQEQVDSIMSRIRGPETIDAEARPLVHQGKKILDIVNYTTEEF